MEIPAGLKYTKTHEWARQEGPLVRVGITDYAQNELGDIVYLELPEVGRSFAREEPFGVIESVKAAADLYMPVGGEIVEVNATAAEELDAISTSPYQEGWLIAVRPADASELRELMDAPDYEQHLAEG